MGSREELLHLLTKENRFTEQVQRFFENAPSGDVKREAVALTGNMFKAHKIVNSLDIHYSTVIFTDNEGMRNRALLLPSNTPTVLFEHSLENQVTFKQVKDIANFLKQLDENSQFSRSNYLDTKIELPYKKARIAMRFSGNSFQVSIQSVAKQLNKFMSNTKVFEDPKNPGNPDSLNINFHEPSRNEFRFQLNLDQVERFIDEVDTTTKIETAFLDLKSKQPAGINHCKDWIVQHSRDAEILDQGNAVVQPEVKPTPKEPENINLPQMY